MKDPDDFNFVFVLWAILGSAQRLLLVGFRRSHGMPRTKAGSATCKASALSFFFFFFNKGLCSHLDLSTNKKLLWGGGREIEVLRPPLE